MPDSIFDSVHVIDLKFQTLSGAIAAFLIPLGSRALLVECGPASTFSALEAGVHRAGYELSDISDLLVTHIHLDHAGAAGKLAQHGARVHVHPRGAPHLANPQRLLTSAGRIYGDEMDRLWGETIPVPQDQIRVVEDRDRLVLGPIHAVVVETLGHATHHNSYVVDGLCFAGDVAGVHLENTGYLELPLPPPDINLDHWEKSVEYLQDQHLSALALTHFGLLTHAGQHLDLVKQNLADVREWIAQIMVEDPEAEELLEKVTDWADAKRRQAGLSGEMLERIEAANPSWMAAAGIRRYWRSLGR